MCPCEALLERMGVLALFLMHCMHACYAYCVSPTDLLRSCCVSFGFMFQCGVLRCALHAGMAGVV